MVPELWFDGSSRTAGVCCSQHGDLPKIMGFLKRMMRSSSCIVRLPVTRLHRNYPLCHGTESQHNDRGWSLSCELKLKLNCETCRPAEPLTCFFLLQLDDDKGPITGFCPEG